jgi:hypothetical protein
MWPESSPGRRQRRWGNEERGGMGVGTSGAQRPPPAVTIRIESLVNKKMPVLFVEFDLLATLHTVNVHNLSHPYPSSKHCLEGGMPQILPA